MLDKSTTQPVSTPQLGLHKPGRLEAMVRKLLFDSFSHYRNALAPRLARWRAQADQASAVFGRDVLGAIDMRDAVLFKSYECNIEGRLPGAVCCDYMQRRLQGWEPARVLQDLRHRSRSFAALPRRETVFRLTEAGLIRLYAARTLNWPVNAADGRYAVPASGTLERFGGLHAPPAFRRAGADGRVAAAVQQACTEALAQLLAERRVDAKLVMMLIEREEDSPSHVVVCDLARDCPGIFDPHYGFMSTASARDMDVAALLAQVAYRYGATALVALQD